MCTFFVVGVGFRLMYVELYFVPHHIDVRSDSIWFHQFDKTLSDHLHDDEAHDGVIDPLGIPSRIE